MTEATIRKLFEKLDTSHDEGLNMLEVKKFLTMYPSNPKKPITDDDIAEYFLKHDKDKSGTISFKEFLAVFNMRDNSEVSPDELEALFKKYDKDNSGFIDACECEVVLSGTKGYTAEKAHNDLKKMDKDGDGRVSIQEFMNNFYQK